MSLSPTPLQISLFALLKRELGGVLPIIRASKATLVHVSHLLEDLILTKQLPALLLTGFQESSHWRAETERYRDLAGIAKQICIFAGQPLPPDSDAKQAHIPLADGDALRQEWFLLILCDRFSVVLCGQDQLEPGVHEAGRQFDTIWSFDPRLVQSIIELLDEVIAHYRPDALRQFRAAYDSFGVVQPDPQIVTRLTAEMMDYEERLNQQLRRQQLMTDRLLESIEHFLYILELKPDQSMLHYISPNIELLVGESADVICATHPKWLLQLIDPDDLPALRDFHTPQLRQSRSSEVEYRLRLPDGSIRWIRDSGHHEPNASQDSVIVYGTLEDITLKKQREIEHQERERLRLELEKQQQITATRTYLMNTVSHEFRTPLTTILSGVEMLERYSERMDESARARRLHTMREQVINLSRMMDDLQLILDGDIDNLGFSPHPVRLLDFFHELRSHWQAQYPTHRITLQLGIEPQTEYVLDARLLKYIISNLLHNALKYSPANSEVHCQIDLEGDSSIMFQISDQGAGIPADDLPHVFDPFYRGHNVNHIPGGGMGLKIAADCVRLHHGMIHLDSREGHGTTATIRLPLTLPQ